MASSSNGGLQGLVQADGADVKGLFEVAVVEAGVVLAFAHVGGHADGVQNKVDLPAKVFHGAFERGLEVFYAGGVCGDHGGIAAGSASLWISPMRMATGALVNTMSAPMRCTVSAVFQAMDMSLRAPKMMPFFPSRRFMVAVGWNRKSSGFPGTCRTLGQYLIRIQCVNRVKGVLDAALQGQFGRAETQVHVRLLHPANAVFAANGAAESDDFAKHGADGLWQGVVPCGIAPARP